MAKMTSTRRKLAIATWAPPAEGVILGKVTLDVSEAVRYIAHVKETTGDKVSITHLVGKAVGEALAKTPTLNGKILFNRFVPFDTVDVTFLIAADGDLAKSKIENVDQKSIPEIAHELRESAMALARTIASKSAKALRLAKQSLNGIELLDVKNSYRFEQGFTLELYTSPDSQESRDAFVEKRDAKFKSDENSDKNSDRNSKKDSRG